MSPNPDDPSDASDASEPSEPDMDTAWDAIVANLRQGEHVPEVPRWPANEDDEPTSAAAPSAEPILGSQWSGWEDLAVTEPEDEIDEAFDDEHYVPPPPDPVPRGDRVLRWGWAGALGAPLLAVLLAISGWDLNGMIGLSLVVAFLAGFVTLVSRMREGPTDDSGPDDGAVI